MSVINKPDLSVIICAHNPRRDYLERTLASLRAQTLPVERWELVLVDNASREPLAGSWDLSWNPGGRHALEMELGLTQARLRGIQETTAELLVFVDDDNELRPDFLEEALAIAGREPGLGCFGAARILPEFEQEPTEALRPFTRVLALRDEATDLRSADPEDWCYPYGAGLVVRRSVATRYVAVVTASRLKMELDRRGDQLNSCGDDEFSWIAIDMGFSRGVFRSLVVRHLIAARRVQKAYLMALYESFGYSRALLLHTHGKVVAKPNAAPVQRKLSWRDPLRFLVKGQLHRARNEARQLLARPEPPSLVQEFEQARLSGLARFHRTHG